MFLRSKYEKELCNQPINFLLVRSVWTPSRNERKILFSYYSYISSDGGPVDTWNYDNEKDCQQEYEWILRVLGSQTNADPIEKGEWLKEH